MQIIACQFYFHKVVHLKRGRGERDTQNDTSKTKMPKLRVAEAYVVPFVMLPALGCLGCTKNTGG